MDIINVKELTFAYSGSNNAVLEDINFNIEKGSLNVIIGSSGSGKSTLLKLLKKNTIPAGRMSGKATFYEEQICNIDDRVNASKIGYVQQNPDNQIVTDKVWHELAFGLESLGMGNVEIRKRVAEMAEYFGITSWYGRNTNDLSGGQKQILNLASVMVMRPEVLLLDEPVAQLDPLTARKFMDVLINLNRDLGLTIIVAEHNLGKIFEYADKCIVLENGKILANGSVREISHILINNDNRLVCGLPAAARIYGYFSKDYNDMPMSVKDGKKWINSFFSETVVDKVWKELKSDNIYDIKLREVDFRYSKGEKNVIDNLSYNILHGRITSILGSNGTGKSTLLKLIAGVHKPDHGRIFVNRKTVMLPQNPNALFTEISVEEELGEILLDDKSMSLDMKREAVENMLERMQLCDVRKNHPYDLSGGQQQKLAIGKLLLLKPEILLLDEPTKGLDPYFKRELGQWLVSLKSEGMTVVLVSHDLEFAAEYSDECALLFDGSIVTSSCTREFFSENMFYTTDVNKIMSDLFKGCITIKDVEEIADEY